MFLFRNGYLEETFFTFSLSPIRDESGGIGGLFHPVTETTMAMLSERRTRALRDLNAKVAEAKTTEAVFASALAILSDFALDLPFVAFYRLDPEGRGYTLAGQAGLPADCALAPKAMASIETAPWPVADLVKDSAPVLVTGLRSWLDSASCGPYEERPDSAFGLPIAAAGVAAPVALIFAGASSRLPMNQAYRDFFSLLAAAVASGMANARAYEDERARSEQLAELDRAKTAFFSNVSHEFRTPLTLMMGPLDDALDDGVAVLPEVQRGRIEMVRRNAVRQLKLVNALLDFSRIEAGRTEASFEPIDLAQVTSELASHFHSACEMAGLRFIVDCPPLGQPVFVDRDMWEKIVLNLVSNAFKFTLAGEIAVRLRASDGKAELTVSDTGAGIPAAEMPRLFERFHRIEGAQGRSYEGSGIGLSLVQELVRLHGGEVCADSAPGQGTTFHVVVPLGSAHLPADRVRAAASSEKIASRADVYVDEALRWLPDTKDGARRSLADSLLATAAGLGGRGRRPLILLADDNSDMRQYVRRILIDAGCDVEAVRDGEMALEALRRPVVPDMVLSDVMMPKLDGFALLRALRADKSVQDVPVILLSARAGEEARVEGLSAGADDYLVKPFGARELVARVEGTLRLTGLRREKADAERRAVERALDETRDRLSLALDSARMGIWDWEIASNELNWTSTAKAIFGKPADAPISYDIFLDTLHVEDRDWVDALCQLCLDPAVRAPYDAQYRVIWPDGGIRWVLARGRAYFDGDRAVRFTGTVLDFTEQKEAEAHLRVLVDELSHRVKNTLAVIRAITDQTFRHGSELGGVHRSLNGRLLALAETHTLLTASKWESVDLAALVQSTVGHLAKDEDDHFSVDGHPVGLTPKASLALALVLHELATNAAKYGAWSIEGGRVAVTWRVAGGELVLEWTESGMAGLTPPSQTGFGSTVIKQAIEYDLDADVAQTWWPNGLYYVLTIPVEIALAAIDPPSI